MWVLLSFFPLDSPWEVWAQDIQFPHILTGCVSSKAQSRVSVLRKLSSLTYSSAHTGKPTRWFACLMTVLMSYCPSRLLPLMCSSPSCSFTFLILSNNLSESHTPILVICSSSPESAHGQVDLAIIHMYLYSNHCSPTRLSILGVQAGSLLSFCIPEVHDTIPRGVKAELQL